MKRMTQEKAEQLIKLASAYIDFSQMPLDDGPTYRIFQEADTDGIYMMESEWDKTSMIFSRLDQATLMNLLQPWLSAIIRASIRISTLT